MKTLLILRHAKSSWKDADIPDHERPLNPRGRRDAPKMGRLLREKNLEPQLIISSIAKRTRQTVALVTEACGYEGEPRFTRDLYAAGPEAYLEVLRQLGDPHPRVMVVGHNPGLELLVEMLTEDIDALPTAALAEVRLPIQSWDALDDGTAGELVNLWVPRQLAERH